MEKEEGARNKEEGIQGIKRGRRQKHDDDGGCIKGEEGHMDRIISAACV